MARMLVRYGVGRTKQLQVSGGRFTVHQLAPVVLLAPVAALAFGPRGAAIFGLGWLAAALLVAGSIGSRLTGGQAVLAGLVAPSFPSSTPSARSIGWFRSWPGSETEIVVVDETGRPPA